MLISRERDKLINAMSFFLENTRHCHKTKLFKLLYFLDFEHYKQTGRSVTGLEYFAWKWGPVPVELYEEIESPEPDMAESFRFEERATNNGGNSMLVMTPLQEFSNEHFSKRELRLMSQLAEQYEDTLAEDIIEATHLENLPWHRVYIEEGKRQQLIPYSLATTDEDGDVINAIASERVEVIRALQ
jgi:uncharacterized phage-associated protein